MSDCTKHQWQSEQGVCPTCQFTHERTYTQSELNAALALRTREAANFVQEQFNVCGMDDGRIPLSKVKARILSLIKPDESAALAERDRRDDQEENK
jgi:hypothetical protein